jgi:hypothetical protein
VKQYCTGISEIFDISDIGFLDVTFSIPTAVTSDRDFQNTLNSLFKDSVTIENPLELKSIRLIKNPVYMDNDSQIIPFMFQAIFERTVDLQP